ncbi:Uncharacterised protein [Cytobacillus firmus]|nr:Uncharacterised protein [Cytobacillus firmus]
MKKLWLALILILLLLIVAFLGTFGIVIIRLAIMIIFSPVTWVILIIIYFIRKKQRS